MRTLHDDVAEARRVIAALAARLLEYAGDDVERMPMIEGDAGSVVMVHAKDCRGSCDYGCGAVAIMSSCGEDGDDPRQIEEVDHGAIRVRGLSRDS